MTFEKFFGLIILIIGFSRFADILFLGVVMICGFVLTIFGFTLITLRKFVKILEEKEKE